MQLRVHFGRFVRFPQVSGEALTSRSTTVASVCEWEASGGSTLLIDRLFTFSSPRTLINCRLQIVNMIIILFITKID